MDRSLARGTAKPVSSRRTSSPGREAPVSISVNPKIASRTGLVSARRVLSTVKRVRGGKGRGVGVSVVGLDRLGKADEG